MVFVRRSWSEMDPDVACAMLRDGLSVPSWCTIETRTVDSRTYDLALPRLPCKASSHARSFAAHVAFASGALAGDSSIRPRTEDFAIHLERSCRADGAAV